MIAEGTIRSDFEAQKIRFLTVSIVFPTICHEVMGLKAIVHFLNVEV